MPQPKSDNDKLIELTVRMENLALLVEKLHEGMEGTNRTLGMKEKITLAQYNIDLNKQAFHEMQDGIKSLEDRIQNKISQAMLGIENKIDHKFDELKKTDDEQKTFMQKFSPWLNGMVWLITLVAAGIAGMVLNGRLQIVP